MVIEGVAIGGGAVPHNPISGDFHLSSGCNFPPTATPLYVQGWKVFGRHIGSIRIELERTIFEFLQSFH